MPEPSPELHRAIAVIQSLAVSQRTNPQELLGILRDLEALHRQICAEMLMPALPNTRHELFALLQNIEANGGWPYIYRVRLQELLQKLRPELP
ncbi:MAG: hypothetical protein HC918_02325 [Oscillatoriales cyanobacterium SM2_1_8]|nr:hypothetical protein [Oscillatoriales cyanobacterium SM2_1_8]